MKKILVIFLAFGLSMSYSQSIEGVIFDKTTNSPVVFANVFTTQKTGVISNSEGAFKINISKLNNKDSLLVSSLGYKALQIPVLKLKTGDTIFLEPQQQMLDEVVVSMDKLSGLEIINRFKDSLPKRHKIDPTKFQVFERNKETFMPVKTGIELDRTSFMTKSKRKRFNENMESYFEKMRGNVSTFFRDKLYNAYYLKDSTGIEHLKSTLLVNEEKDNSMDDIQKNVFKELMEALDTKSTFKVRTGIIPLEDSLSTEEFIEKDEPEKKDTLKNKYYKWSYANIISKSQSLGSLEFFDETKKYEYDIEDTKLFNGDIVYVINIIPDRGSAKYKAKAYINAEDFGLLKLDYELLEGKKEAGINLKFLLGVKFRSDQSKVQYIFKRGENQKYYPFFYRTSLHNYVYFDRGFVFKENEENGKERIKFKISLFVESNTINEEEYVIINTEDINPNEDHGFSVEDFIFREKLKRYDPEIWKDFNILQATEEIKNYK